MVSGFSRGFSFSLFQSSRVSLWFHEAPLLTPLANYLYPTTSLITHDAQLHWPDVVLCSNSHFASFLQPGHPVLARNRQGCPEVEESVRKKERKDLEVDDG